jgi:hypothetical protein
VRLAVVYGRSINEEVTTFGTTGYTLDRTFVLYDRQTESLWYPLDSTHLTAISGPRINQTVPLLSTPEVTTLAEWVDRHPDTTILIDD